MVTFAIYVNYAMQFEKSATAQVPTSEWSELHLFAVADTLRSVAE